VCDATKDIESLRPGALARIRRSKEKHHTWNRQNLPLSNSARQSHGMGRRSVVYNSIRCRKAGQSPSATRTNGSLIPKVELFVRIAYELRTSLHKNGTVTERSEDLHIEWSRPVRFFEVYPKAAETKNCCCTCKSVSVAIPQTFLMGLERRICISITRRCTNSRSNVL